MLYCAATETGYESISGQSCEIFIPTVQKDSDGNVTEARVRATTRDYLQLAIAAIIAAYFSRGQQPPVTSDDILYRAASQEVTALITAVIELRTEWYAIPTVVPVEEGKTEEGEQPKN